MTWNELLRKAVLAEGSQASVAARIGYSPAAISQAISGNYNGSTEAIAQAVLATYGGKAMQQTIPDGYMQNAVGHLVPIESIKEIDLVRDEFVRQTITRAKEFSERINQFKSSLAGDFQAFIDLSAEKYGVTLGGIKGNVCLTSFDGGYKVMRDVSERIEFDERLQAAKALIDQCLSDWTRDAGSEIRTLINDAFQVDKKGRINTKRILGLRKLKIEHPTWLSAMEAIGDAVTVTGSCTYYRLHERTDSGDYVQINLDFSGV